MSYILLVEDNLDLCHMLSSFLQKEGYTVISVTDGFTALKQFRKEIPALVLLDLMLPRIGGMEVCWIVRSFSDVPIIILSAKRELVDIRWGFKAGADDYITKPFDIDKLNDRIKAVLDARSLN